MSSPLTDRLLAELQREFPRLRVCPKSEDVLQRLTALALRVATLNGQRTYLSHYTTVFGHTIFTPSEWDQRSDAQRYITLRHEAVHLRQMARLGQIRMALLYGLWVFPIGLAWGRARLEWEAYAETLRASAEVYGIDFARSTSMREHLVTQFTSAAYGWMWPFPAQVNRWIDEEIGRIEASLRETPSR